MHLWKNKVLKVRYYAARDRCTSQKNKAYSSYGGRGISFEFESPQQFEDWALSNGWKEGLYLDRIDNDGPYSPKNCRFVTIQESNKNRRGVLIHNGRTLPELCREANLPYHTVRARIKKGATLDVALALPITPNGVERRRGLPTGI